MENIEENAKKANDPPINMAEALHRAMGDTELIQMLLDDFKSMVGLHVEKIDLALKGGDTEALEKEAHQLKGAAGSLSVKGVAAIAYDLEQMGSGEKEINVQAVADLKNEMTRFLEYIEHYDWSNI